MVGIYKITSPSNKIYIGQSTNIEKRIIPYQRLYCKSQTKLYNSLKKYGWDNHKFEIIEECSESLLIERENYWKDYYKVLSTPSLCCRKDGKGGYLSQETKDLISKSSKGVSRNKNRKQTPQEKELRSKIKKGYQPSISHIENMRKGMLGKNIKSIKCLTTNETFDSIKSCAEKYKINPDSIGNILRGRAKQTREGYQFNYINI